MSLLDEVDRPCPRGCGRTMDDCYEAEDGGECAGSDLVQRLKRELIQVTHRAERAEVIVGLARTYRKAVAQWDCVRDVATPVGALIFAVDAYDAKEATQ